METIGKYRLGALLLATAVLVFAGLNGKQASPNVSAPVAAAGAPSVP